MRLKNNGKNLIDHKPPNGSYVLPLCGFISYHVHTHILIQVFSYVSINNKIFIKSLECVLIKFSVEQVINIIFYRKLCLCLILLRIVIHKHNINNIIQNKFQKSSIGS